MHFLEWIYEFSPKFAPKGPVNNIPALAQIMAWRRTGDKPLSEPMLASLLTQYVSLGLNELKCVDMRKYTPNKQG